MPTVRGNTNTLPAKYRGLSFRDVLQQGRKLYKLRQFEPALEAFEAARVLRDDPFQLELVDHLAAVYEKSGRLQAALRESRLLIKNHETSSRGYLRAGRILKSLGCLAETVAVYRLGLRNVSKTDPNLQMLREKLKSLPDLARLKDPLDILPPEMAVMVFGKVDFISLMALLRVSKRWYKFLSSQRVLWEDLDFLPAKKPLKRAAVLSGLRIGHPSVKRIRMRDLSMDESAFKSLLSVMITRCPRLEEIEVKDYTIKVVGLLDTILVASNLKKLRLSCEVRLESVAMLLSRTKLVKARFGQVLSASRTPIKWQMAEKLESLHLGLSQNGAQEMPVHLRNMHEAMPNLKKLSLSYWRWHRQHRDDFSNFPRLTSVSLVACQIEIWPKLPPTLSYLFLSSAKFISMADPESQENILSANLPCLRALHLSHLSGLTFSDLDKIATNSATNGFLQELELHDCIITKPDMMEVITSGFLRPIFRLAISNADCVDDELAEAISTLPNLTSLDLSHNKNITGVGIKKLVLKEGKTLDLLTINSCPKIRRDAIEYAREIIRRVDFILEGDRPGRVVRYS